VTDLQGHAAEAAFLSASADAMAHPVATRLSRLPQYTYLCTIESSRNQRGTILIWPARFTPESGGYVVTVPDIPEVITEGDSFEEAVEYAVDAIECVLAEYIRRRRDIPKPSRRSGRDIHAVALPAVASAKLELYSALRAAGIGKADLGRRLGWRKTQVERLLDLSHASRMDQIEAAFRVLGKRLAIEVLDAA
jgi:antitoxin HicB